MRLLAALFALLLPLHAIAQTWTMDDPVAFGVSNYDQTFTYTLTGARESPAPHQDVTACAENSTVTLTGAGNVVSIHDCYADDSPRSGCNNVKDIFQAGTNPIPVNFVRGYAMVLTSVYANPGEVTIKCNQVVNKVFNGSVWVPTFPSEPSPLDAKYLVGEDSVQLTDEIIVGLAPGGDLQGAGTSWAAPRVSNDSHNHTTSTVPTPSEVIVEGDIGVGLEVNAGQVDTKSDEIGFLEDLGTGSLSCFPTESGKVALNNSEPLAYCDGTSLSVKRWAAYGDVSGLIEDFSNAAVLDAAGNITDFSDAAVLDAAGNITDFSDADELDSAGNVVADHSGSAHSEYLELATGGEVLGALKLSDQLDYGVIRWLLDSATPDVSTGISFRTLGAVSTVTDFLGGSAVQPYIIVTTLDAGKTFNCTSGNLNCGTADLVTAVGDVTVWFYSTANSDWSLVGHYKEGEDYNLGGNRSIHDLTVGGRFVIRDGFEGFSAADTTPDVQDASWFALAQAWTGTITAFEYSGSPTGLDVGHLLFIEGNIDSKTTFDCDNSSGVSNLECGTTDVEQTETEYSWWVATERDTWSLVAFRKNTEDYENITAKEDFGRFFGDTFIESLRLIGTLDLGSPWYLALNDTTPSLLDAQSDTHTIYYGFQCNDVWQQHCVDIYSSDAGRPCTDNNKQCSGVPDGKCDYDGNYPVLAAPQREDCTDVYNTPAVPAGGDQTSCSAPDPTYPCDDGYCDDYSIGGAGDTAVGSGDTLCDEDALTTAFPSITDIKITNFLNGSDGQVIVVVGPDPALGGQGLMYDCDGSTYLNCGTFDIDDGQVVPGALPNTTIWQYDAVLDVWNLLALETFSDVVKVQLRGDNTLIGDNTFKGASLFDGTICDDNDLDGVCDSGASYYAISGTGVANFSQRVNTDSIRSAVNAWFTMGDGTQTETRHQSDDGWVFLDAGFTSSEVAAWPGSWSSGYGTFYTKSGAPNTAWHYGDGVDRQLAFLADINQLGTEMTSTDHDLISSEATGLWIHGASTGFAENLTWDFGSENGVVNVGSTTGVAQLDFGARDIETTGGMFSYQHQVVSSVASQNLTADIMRRYLVYATYAGGLQTIKTPNAAAEMEVCFIDYSTDGNGLLIKPQAPTADHYWFDGADLGAIVGIQSDGNHGEYVCLHAIDTTNWVVTNISDGWYVEGGSPPEKTAVKVSVMNPDVANEFVLELPPHAGTMKTVRCEAFGGTSVTINICDGEDLGDDTCAVSILDATASTTLTCTTSPTSDTALNATGFAASDKLSLVLTAESGSVNQLNVSVSMLDE